VLHHRARSRLATAPAAHRLAFDEPAAAAGLTVGGPIDVARDKEYWAQKIVDRYCYPSVQKWPTLEAYWDVFWYPPMCEFTIQSPMAQNAYVWGYLAGRN